MKRKRLIAALLSFVIAMSFSVDIGLTKEVANDLIGYDTFSESIMPDSELSTSNELIEFSDDTASLDVESEQEGTLTNSDNTMGDNETAFNEGNNEVLSDEKIEEQKNMFTEEEILNMDDTQIQGVNSDRPRIVVSQDELPRNQQPMPIANDELIGHKLYNINIEENNLYNKNVSGNVAVNQTSGNVNYSYTLASIPGKNNSVMSLGIEYNVSQSKFATLYADIDDTSDYYAPPQMEYENCDVNLGAGWEFSGLKRRFDGGYTKLRDGRMVNGKESDHGGYTIDGDIITYADGTKEILGADYISSIEDKYGNKITYNYDEGVDGTDRLRSVEDSLGRKISINYYDNYIDVIKPDNSIIRLNTKNVNVEHIGQFRGFDETLTVKTISYIQNVTDKQSLALFEYEPIEFEQFIFPAGGQFTSYAIQADDYAVSMLMTEIDTKFNGVYKFTYVPVPDRKQRPLLQSVLTQTRYLCAETEYKGNFTNPMTTYSYEFNQNNLSELTVTAVSSNNAVTENFLGEESHTEKVYERKGTSDVLKQSISKDIISKSEISRPSYISIETYNDDGDVIQSEYSYKYDDEGNILTSKETIEGEEKISRENTYYGSDKNYALKSSSTKKGSNIFQKTEYEVNSLGDVTDEKIYDGNGNLQRHTAYGYNNNNLSSKTVYSGSTSNILQRENYEYNNGYMTYAYTKDNAGNIISANEYLYNNKTGLIERTYDANTVENIKYDSLGRIIKETHADGTYKNIGYEHIDVALGFTNENGYHYEYFYNGYGEVGRIEEISKDGGWSVLRKISYDVMGNPISDADALGNTTTITYDAFGRQTSVKYPGNSTSAKAVYMDVVTEGSDKYSVVVTISETGRISLEYYDVYGRLEKTAKIKNYSSFSESSFKGKSQIPSTAQLVITSRYVYDDLDRVIEEYDGENRPTYYTYDAMGNVIQTRQGNTSQISVNYQYNAMGNVTKMTQGNHITSYIYDYAGRVTNVTDPMGYTEKYTYDTAGNIKTSTDKNGTVTTNTYNNRGLLSKTSKGGEYINYTYDAVGNLLTSADKSGTIKYTYNYDNTLAAKTYPDGKKITYNYNVNKTVSSMTDYLNNTTAYAYNSRGLVTSIAEKYSGSSTSNTTSYSYNADGSLSKVTYPLSSYMYEQYSYDYAGRVSTLTNKLTSSSNYSTHTYTYDNSGNVTQKVDNIQGTSTTTKYVYDSLNRLIREDINGSWNVYSYDEHNNLTDEIGWGDTYYKYDANNRLVNVRDLWTSGETADGTKMDDWEINYTYDKNGNLLSSSKASAPNCYGYTGNQKTYKYDAWGQLINYSDSLGDTAVYTYYSDGLRASKTIGGSTTKYYYDGDNVVNETLNGSSYATNIMGVNGYISRRQNGTTGYFFQDAHGDILAAYSSTTNKLASYTYNAWGKMREITESSGFARNPIRYSGQYYDYESGMTYLRARYYDSGVRRFISEDPARSGANWYVYCSDNPVAFIDPHGLCEKCFNSYEEYYDYILEGTKPIYVEETKDAINISVFVLIFGPAADIPIDDTGRTYRQAGIAGIIDCWGGEYNGKAVNVNVVDFGDGNTKQYQKALIINMKAETGTANCYVGPDNPGPMETFIKQVRYNGRILKYGYKTFGETVAHEFGHALGIDDLYSDEGVPKKFVSIMNDEHVAKHAQPIDYAMMLQAQRDNKFQVWHDNGNLIENMVDKYYDR